MTLEMAHALRCGFSVDAFSTAYSIYRELQPTTIFANLAGPPFPAATSATACAGHFSCAALATDGFFLERFAVMSARRGTYGRGHNLHGARGQEL